jgi:amino acid transporter
VLITLLNLRGIRTTARANLGLLIAMSVVIAAFLVLAVKYLSVGGRVLFSLRPIYDIATFDVRAIATATSFAALTYIGFDGLTTLAEDVENPRRNIPLATVSVCLFTALFSCLLVYLAQLIYPDYRIFADIETAFMDVTRTVGGESLFQGMGLVVILSSFGAAMAGEVAAARVMFAMGRDGVLPARFFARLSLQSDNPTINILLISLIAWTGSLLLSLERAGELLNFGALLGFMGVNVAAFRQCYLLRDKSKRRVFFDAMAPVLGFVFCLAIWLTLPAPAKIIGGTWLLVGIVYYTLRLRLQSAKRADRRERG